MSKQAADKLRKSILAKGRVLFSDIKPQISVGGGAQSTQRVIEISRMAALMEKNGIPVVVNIPKSPEPVFIPSACWRNIAPGILSTTRFIGMLIAGEHRLAVYDIGDGVMEWRARAEGSLFYTRYGSYATKATGMLLVCHKEARIRAARILFVRLCGTAVSCSRKIVRNAISPLGGPDLLSNSGLHMSVSI